VEHFVSPEGLPPVNGYSHAVAFTGRMRQVFENLAGALAAAGARIDQVVKLTVCLTDLADLEAFRRVRDEYIALDTPPASSLVQVSGLVNPEFRVEIEALAAIEHRAGWRAARAEPDRLPAPAQ
jgi:enamine deaminase RidA (YjgF/YER057c/UK114 family)